MNRQTAVRLVGKLRNVTEARGATPGEARVAAAKAAQLEARFGPVQDAPLPSTRDSVFVASPFGAPTRAPMSFNVKTGSASSNVKVHRYNSPSDWHIEIFQ